MLTFCHHLSSFGSPAPARPDLRPERVRWSASRAPGGIAQWSQEGWNVSWRGAKGACWGSRPWWSFLPSRQTRKRTTERGESQEQKGNYCGNIHGIWPPRSGRQRAKLGQSAGAFGPCLRLEFSQTGVLNVCFIEIYIGFAPDSR